MYEVSKCAPQEALRNLDRAFERWLEYLREKKKGKRPARRVGFPAFKSRKRRLGSFRLFGTIRVSRRSIILPRIGEVKLKECDYLPTEGVEILSATVSERAGRWFVSLQVEEEIDDPVDNGRDGIVVGVDLGIKNLATTSDGETFKGPEALSRNLRKLRRLEREKSRRQPGSKNRAKTRHKLAKTHARVANIRKDALHKLTTHLTKTKSAVVLEDLNVAGMVKNPFFARAIADMGFGEFRRQLLYKAEWYGCYTLMADRFFPSSKTCSKCGAVKADLKPSDRRWTCPGCKARLDRDPNAALNLKRYGERMLAGSPSDSLNACGGSGTGRRKSSGETIPDEAGTERRIDIGLFG